MIDVAGDIGSLFSSHNMSGAAALGASRRLRWDENPHSFCLQLPLAHPFRVVQSLDSCGLSGEGNDLSLRTRANDGAFRRERDLGDPTGDSLADDDSAKRRAAQRRADSIRRPPILAALLRSRRFPTNGSENSISDETWTPRELRHGFLRGLDIVFSTSSLPGSFPPDESSGGHKGVVSADRTRMLQSGVSRG